jgi:hypothetical protein
MKQEFNTTGIYRRIRKDSKKESATTAFLVLYVRLLANDKLSLGR